MTAPIDQEARRKAVERLDLSMAYSAGAGAGKTTVLVSRVVALLREGMRPERIAVVTFTKKATQELAERIRDELEAAFEQTSGLERERIAGALRDISDLTVSTIHSFCQQLLHAEALEAGWAPSTELLAASLVPSAADDAFEAWRRGFAQRHPEAARTVWKLESVRSLRKAAGLLLDNRDLAPVVGANEPRFEDADAELATIVETLQSAFSQCLNRDGCKLASKNGEVIALFEYPEATPTERVRVALATGSDLRGGSKKDWPDDSKTRFVDAIKELREYQSRWKNIEFEPLHRLVIEDMLAEFVPTALAQKSLLGQADYQDLLFGACALLSNAPEARKRLADRFSAVLVDEVQDTDPVQSEVVALLGRDPSMNGRWDEHPVRPGAVFAVGDHKQSIYRFRRADPEQWRLLDQLIQRNGASESLVQNFRSAPGIVSWVNHVFQTMPGFEELVAFREPSQLDPVVAIHDDGTGEADAVARYLLHLHQSDAEVHVDGALRPMRWRDVMILVPAWTNAEELQNTLLRAGVPCVVEGGKEFFKRDEVRIAHAALRAIDEPADSEAVVFVLRGLFGISLDELAEHRQRGGSWRYTLPEQPPGPVTEALRTLQAMYRKRGTRSWLSILDELLEHTRAASVWSLTARGSAIPANLDKFRICVRQCEEAARSASEAIHILDRLAAEAEQEDLSTIDVDSDEVSIMTHYGAKGLEAPIVILPFANRKFTGADYVVDREAGQIAIPVGKYLKPPGWDEWSAREKEETIAERQRWMYVATTRARDQLVLIVNRATRNATGNLVQTNLTSGLPDPDTAEHDVLCNVAPGVSVRSYLRPELPAVQYEESSFPGFDPMVDAYLADPVTAPDRDLDRWDSDRVSAIASAKRASTPWKSVTELARRSKRTKRVTKDEVGTGTVVHRVMEQLDLHLLPEELMEEAKAHVVAFADEEDLPEEYREKAVEIIEKLLNHPSVVRARTAPEHWKEVPFAFNERGRVVAGTIDFCFPLDASRQRWCVVDWKVELPAVGDPRRADYERQLAIYAKALIKNIAGIEPDIEQVLVGPHPELGESEVGAEAEISEANAELQEPLLDLVEAGLPVPCVGSDIGEPVIAASELYWDDRKLVVTLDAPDEEVAQMRAAGYEVEPFKTSDPIWVESVVTRLVKLFDLKPETVETDDVVSEEEGPDEDE